MGFGEVGVGLVVGDEVRGLRRALSRAQMGGNFADAGAVDAVSRELDQLLMRLNLESGGKLDIDTTVDRNLYIARGTAEENTELLYRMTLDRLDLIENVLMIRRAEPVRAQTPRDSARDSEAASRYFRLLSNTEEEFE